MIFDNTRYWEQRYRHGGTSGDGSYGDNAAIKASVVNRFLTTHSIRSIVDWGCGDGNQLAHFVLPDGCQYLGVDTAPVALERCRARHPYLRFVHASEVVEETAELALSLDVLFHFPDDDAYHGYLDRVCASAGQWLLMHTTDHDEPARGHMRHRQVSASMAERHPEWVRHDIRDGINDCVFLIYQHQG